MKRENLLPFASSPLSNLISETTFTCSPQPLHSPPTRAPSDLKTRNPERSVKSDLSVFILGAVHSKRRRPSLGRACRSTTLLGTTDDHGTGGRLIPHAEARSRMSKNRINNFLLIML